MNVVFVCVFYLGSCAPIFLLSLPFTRRGMGPISRFSQGRAGGRKRAGFGRAGAGMRKKRSKGSVDVDEKVEIWSFSRDFGGDGGANADDRVSLGDRSQRRYFFFLALCSSWRNKGQRASLQGLLKRTCVCSSSGKEGEGRV